MLALVRRWLSRGRDYVRHELAMSADLRHLDDGVRRLGFGDEPWDVWGDE